MELFDHRWQVSPCSWWFRVRDAECPSSGGQR